MEFKFEKVNAAKIHDAFSGVSLMEVNNTISSNLSPQELKVYDRAIQKVMTKKTLNRNDLRVLDKVDLVTMEKHKMCLKDSLVTKARIKAAKRYRMKFIDRDGLVDHMNSALEIMNSCNQDEFIVDPIMNCLEGNMCSDCLNKLNEASFKIANQIPLTEDDVWIMQEALSIIFEELGYSFEGTRIGNALIEACDELGIAYNGLSGIIPSDSNQSSAHRYH